LLYFPLCATFNQLLNHVTERMYTNETTDEWLLSQLKEGDSEAFEAIYRRYWRQLFVFVYDQIGSREDTREILQELMLSIWENRSVAKIRNLRAFLFISARNLANMYFRREINLRKYREYRLLQEVSESVGNDDILHEKQLAEALEKALESLPEKTANIFRMNKLEDVPIQDIALQLGLSGRTVAYHLTKSVRAIRKHCQKYLSDN
jgi:RNA polymerase sigma factor (sigma-70 family)